MFGNTPIFPLRGLHFDLSVVILYALTTVAESAKEKHGSLNCFIHRQMLRSSCSR